jgi:hypothetical protein
MTNNIQNIAILDGKNELYSFKLHSTRLPFLNNLLKTLQISMRDMTFVTEAISDNTIFYLTNTDLKTILTNPAKQLKHCAELQYKSHKENNEKMYKLRNNWMSIFYEKNSKSGTGIYLGTISKTNFRHFIIRVRREMNLSAIDAFKLYKESLLKNECKLTLDLLNDDFIYFMRKIYLNNIDYYIEEFIKDIFKGFNRKGFTNSLHYDIYSKCTY